MPAMPTNAARQARPLVPAYGCSQPGEPPVMSEMHHETCLQRSLRRKSRPCRPCRPMKYAKRPRSRALRGRRTEKESGSGAVRHRDRVLALVTDERVRAGEDVVFFAARGTGHDDPLLLTHS